MSGPWYGWFVELLSGTLDVKLSAPARCSGSLGREDAEVASRILDARLKKVHVPSRPEISLVKKLLGACAAHAQAFYESSEAFLRQIAQDVIELNPEPPVFFITGGAGRGKSAVFCALKEMMAPRSVRPSEQLPAFPLIGVLFLRVDGRTKRKDLLNALAAMMGFPADYKSADNGEIQRMRGQLYKAGVMMIAVDELQFWSTSLTAHASVTSGLYFLRSLGVPIAFIGNFSLAKKLLSRPPEDVQRLLADVTTLVPLSVSDPHLEQILCQYGVASEGAIKLSSAEVRQLRWYTVENRRALRMLCVSAYEIARGEGRTGVRMADFRAAYEGHMFSPIRRDLEAERSFIVTGQAPRRAGIVSPFEATDEERAEWNSLNKEMKELLAQIAKARAQLTPTERAGLQALEGAPEARPKVPDATGGTPKTDRLSTLLASRPRMA
jgi:hypothetical protein